MAAFLGDGGQVYFKPDEDDLTPSDGNDITTTSINALAVAAKA